MFQIVQYQKTGKISVEDLPDIKLFPGGILVQNYYSLISAGTERTSVKTAQASLFGKAKMRPDLVKQVLENIKREGLIATYKKVMNRLDNYKELGYSSAGIVLASNVDEFKPGDRVACAGYAYHSELIFVPKNLAVKVPDNVSLEEASFIAIGAIALQGIRQAKINLGENVVVIGLGLIGLVTIQLLKASGCRVIGTDISERNFNLAREFGCDEVALFDNYIEKVVESFTKGYGADAIIITTATNSNEPIEKAISFARKKGRVVVVGVTGMDIPRTGFYEKELEITISCSYGPGRYEIDYEQKGIDYPFGYVRWTEKRNMEAVIQLLSEGKISFSRLITHKIPVEEGLKAYDLITGKIDEPYIGILIEYNKEPKKEFVRIRKNIKGENKISDIVVGFIGAGNFAQSYLLPYLKGKVTLKNVATRKPINAKSVAEKFGFIEYSSDPSVIFEDKNINTVFIVTHHDSHGFYVKEALKYGKNIFVEKPLTVREDELYEIKKLYDESNVHLMVGFNRRFSKQFALIKDFISKSRDPIVINYRINAGSVSPNSWLQDWEQGGRIIGEACHFIDIFDYLIDSEPVSVYAVSSDSNNSKRLEENIVVTIGYNNGSVANLLYLSNGSNSLPKEYCEVFSGGLVAVMDDFKRVILYSAGKKKKVKFNTGKGHKEEVEHFLKVLRGEEKPKLSFDSIYKTTFLTFKIIESYQNRAVIYL